MTGNDSIFVVQRKGDPLVVGFRNWPASLQQVYVTGGYGFSAEARDELRALIDEHPCHAMAINMAPVVFLPSWFLGLLVSVQKSGVRIELRNLTEQVRDSLKVTRLHEVLAVRD